MIDLATISLVAKKSGLTAGGISPVTLGDKYIKALQVYLDNGYNAEMFYLKRWRDYNRTLGGQLPWARSVLVGIDNYYYDATLPNTNPRWTRYVWGRDYHRVVREKMLTVLHELRKIEPTVQGKIYVDTGPILAKAYAEQAGLGWIGKNCLFIAHGWGSFIFIGLLFLNVAIETTPQIIPSGCGDCQLCLQRCPSGALQSPGYLDARRCIAYLTIEKKTLFCAAEAQIVKGHLYGCDICQEICPFNRKWAKNTGDARYYTLLPQLQRSIEEWSHLTPLEFESMFQSTAVKRLGFVRFCRNLVAQSD